MERFTVKKVVTTVALLIEYLLVALHNFRFEITVKRIYVRFMHKQKVTKLGSLKLPFP